MEDDRSGEPSGRVFAWVVRGVVLAIALLFISMAPFRHGTSRIDLANGVIEYTNRSWWGATSSVSTKKTWVGEHRSVGNVEPIWRPLGVWNRGSWITRGRTGSSRWKVARFDNIALEQADAAGVIPAEIRPLVADAVRAQWLRMAADDEHPAWDNDETIASQLHYWRNDCRVLTAEELLYLEHGTPWHEVFYPE